MPFLGSRPMKQSWEGCCMLMNSRDCHSHGEGGSSGMLLGKLDIIKPSNNTNLGMANQVLFDPILKTDREIRAI